MTTLPQTTSIQLPRPVGPGGAITPAMPTNLGAQGHTPQSQMTGADIWRVIRSNMWLIIASVAVAGVAGYFLNTYLRSFHARYTATGYVQIMSGRVMDPIGQNRNQDVDANPLIVEQKSEATIMKS